MRCKRVRIDSLSLSGKHVEAIFIHDEDYIIEAVKSKSVFRPEIWSEAFGKGLTRNVIEANIIHTYLGLKIPLKVFASSKENQTVEFAGLHGYNERSRLLMRTVGELRDRLGDARIARMDVAIDFNGRIPRRITKTLSGRRTPYRYGNTTYWKTAREEKTNQRMDIKIYDKRKQADLDFDLMRLEFVFRGAYFAGMRFRDIARAYEKMEKSIKRAVGLSVKIAPLP